MTDTCYYAFSKPTESETPKANYVLWVIITCQCRFILVTKVPLWWGIFIMGEGEAVGGQRVHRDALQFLFNFAVNLELL